MMNRLRNCWLLAGALMVSLTLAACEEATNGSGSGGGAGGTVRGCGTTIIDNAVSPPAWIHGTWYPEGTNRAVPFGTFTSDNMIIGGVNFKETRYASIMSDSTTANTYTFRQCVVSTPERVVTLTFRRETSTRITLVNSASSSPSILVK